MPAAHRILIVDDDPQLLTFVARYLSRHGFETETFLSAEEARHRFLGKPDFQLIILDGTADLGNYSEFCEEVRSKCQNARILVWSGYPQQGCDLVDQFGPNARFLAKPFTPSKLIQTVKELTALDSPQ